MSCSEAASILLIAMIKKPTALRASPSKEQVYQVFTRLLQQWPEDALRPTRSIRNLKPITPENPAFDVRHYYYQSAAMKTLLQNQLRRHGFPSLGLSDFKVPIE